VNSKALSTVRFADYAQKGLISDGLLRGIPFEFCTPVQAETLDAILTGEDVYVHPFHPFSIVLMTE